MTDVTFDPFDASQVQNAWPTLERLRRQAAVVPLSEGMYYVTRLEEARQVLRDHTGFSNAAGFRAPGVEVPSEDRMLGEQDPPQHPFVRRVVNQALSPNKVRDEEPFIRDAARRLLDALPASGRADMVEAFTVPLPNLVTVHLLGFPLDDADRIAHWSREVMESEWPAMNRTAHGEGFDGAFPEYTAYIDARIAALREEAAAGRPADDVIARLVQLDVDGNRLSDRQVRALTYNLLLGGLTTTSQLLGNLVYVILTDAALRERLRSDPALIGAAIEESLRIHPPVLLIPRGCVKDTEVAGVQIRAGERVVVGSASANRDESLFADGAEFRPERDNVDRHVTFGFGIHLCVGAALARAVARIGVEEFLAGTHGATMQLEPGYTFENVPTYFEYGPKRLPVVTGSGRS